jgi:hypothetical protein
VEPESAYCQALGEKYGKLAGYEEEGPKTTKEPKHKGRGKKTLQLPPSKEENAQVRLKTARRSVILIFNYVELVR